MDTKSEHSKTPVYYWLIAVILALIAVQVIIVKGYGVKHVPIKAGWYEPMPDFEIGGNDAARERLLWLESSLAPPPLLVWSDKPPPLLEYRSLELDATGGNNISTPNKDLIETPSSNLKPVLPESSHVNTSTLSGQVIEVSAYYVRELPDLRSVEVSERKAIFISIILPHILRANQELQERRRRIINDYANDNEERIRKWAELYAIDDTDNLDMDQLYEELMLRVDSIPVTLTLAQAIVESGWGTSRFARQGNALFGEWAWSESKGIKPLSASNDRAVVRSFVTIFDSVRSYMHNLNTHDAYENLRQERHKYRDGDLNLLTQRLISTLDKYAEDGEIYIRKLRNIVQTNNLEIYNNTVLVRAN